MGIYSEFFGSWVDFGGKSTQYQFVPKKEQTLIKKNNLGYDEQVALTEGTMTRVITIPTISYKMQTRR